MKPHVRLLAAAVSVVTLVAGAGAANAHAHESPAPLPRNDSRDQPLGTKAIATVPAHIASSAPRGYRLVSTQLLSRHGARGLSSAKYTELGLAMADHAAASGSLTPAGAAFRAETVRMAAANEKIGWGNLSALGRDQMRQMGGRLADRAGAALALSGKYRIESSGEARATASAREFAAGLASARPGLTLGDVVPDTGLLYFHKSNTTYNDYVKDDPSLAAAQKRIETQPRIVAAEKAVLTGLFGSGFVADLTAGKITLTTADGKSKVADLAGATDIVYGLYSISPALRAEGPFDYERFLPAWTRPLLGLRSDAQDFLEKGPSLAGRTQTYAMAAPLLADVFTSMETAPATGVRGVFRFTHAEEVIPFLALLQVRGSDRQLPVNDTFSYAKTGWYGYQQAPLGANIQWDVFTNSSGTTLVRMLLDEQPARFKKHCHVYSGTLYRLDELKRCYATELSLASG